jgi:hypothetical protein
LPILQDASTPAAVDLTGTTGGTVSTATFTPPANSMVVIVATIGYLNPASAPTVTCADSGAVSYTAGPAVFDTLYAGAYVFTHFYSSSPGPITVTVTRTVALGAAQMSIIPFVLNGTNSSQAGAASLTFSTASNVSAFNRSFTPTTPGSWSIIGASIGNQMSGAPTAVGVTTDHYNSDGTDFVSEIAGHQVTGTPAASNMGWTWSSNSDYAWVALEILPSTGTATPSLADVAGSRETITAAVATAPAEAAGAADSINVAVLPSAIPEGEVAAAEEDLSVAINQANTLTDRAAAADGITVLVGGAPAPTPGTAIKLANPAFIRSQMPRMHIQNLLTGQWFHRDVQGMINPSITWSLNSPDAFTCNLAVPRADMMDASGNAVVLEWRDAIYLEESDEIKFGGIITQSQIQGPSWSITAMGFSGYPNSMPYEGPDYVRTKIDALDVVRYLWNWLQQQPGGNLNMDLGTAKCGFLLGAQVDPGVTSELARDAKVGDTSIWIGNAQAFNRNETITIAGQPYTTTNVVHNPPGHATGQMFITPALQEPHKQHEAVTQTSPVFATLARAAPSGANNVWFGTSAPFANGELITIAGDQYTINNIVTDSNGTPTGNVTLTTNTRKAYAAGVPVLQVRTVTPFELHWWNSTDIGSEIGSIRDEAIFDWREVHTWGDASRNTVHHQMVFGVPRIGRRLTGLRFAEGENIVEPVTMARDGTKYANNVVGLGAGTGSAQLRVTAADASTGRLRRTFVYTDQTAYTNARISAKAAKVLTAMKNIDSVTSVVVKNHPNAPFGSFGPGDDIPVMIASGWRNTTIWSRITAMTQDPTTDLMTLSLARSDSFTYQPDTGLAGTM